MRITIYDLSSTIYDGELYLFLRPEFFPMNITIRNAEPRDVPAMLALIKELALYEKAPDEVITTEASMLKDGFGEEKIYDSIVAEAKGRVVGVAIYYVVYSTWKGRIIYLDDLVVTESFRRFGIGKKLFDELTRITKEAGVHQLRWHVLNWNMPAIKFYEKYHASLDPDWISCKLTREQIL